MRATYRVLGQDFDDGGKREILAVVELKVYKDDRELLRQLPYLVDVKTESVYAIVLEATQ